MEAMAVILPIVAGGMGAAGTLLEGGSAAANAKFEEQQLKIKADQEVGLAGAEAARVGRETKLANSRNLALAAASGGGAADPTVLQIMGDVEAEGVRNSLTEMYKGFSRKADLLTQANATRVSGKRARTGSYIGAAGTLLGGLAGGADNYNRLK